MSLIMMKEWGDFNDMTEEICSINQSQQASLRYSSNERKAGRFVRKRRIQESAKVWREWKMQFLLGRLLHGMFGRCGNAGTCRNFGYEEHRQQCSNEQHSSSCSAHTILLLVHLNKGSKTCALINNLFTNQFWCNLSDCNYWSNHNKQHKDSEEDERTVWWRLIG